MDYGFIVKDLLDELKRRDLLVDSNVDETLKIDNISYNSKSIPENCLFICKGFTFKEAYLNDAIQSGCVSYLSRVKYDNTCPAIIVSDERKALAVCADLYYHTHTDPIDIIGVTGTKGKSTTTYFIHNILEKAKVKNAYSTTVDMFDGEKSVEAILTTPESDVCHKNLSIAKKNGCKCFIMETSSQALKLDRIYTLNFKYGVFVNISPDHISPNEHKDFDEYFGCKKDIVRLYENSVINLDDEHFDEVFDAAKENSKTILRYSVESNDCEIYAYNIVKDGFSTIFDFHLVDHELSGLRVNIPGIYNVSNALAAAGIGYLMGLSDEAIKAGVEVTKVPGRTEIFVSDDKSKTVIVDYAHNEKSMEEVLKAIKDYYPEKKIVTLFGCPGEKAITRREAMATQASRFASFVYVSSEDPGNVDPMAIALEVQSYLKDTPSTIITDRKEAVITAIHDLKADEILLITGKGNEHYQIIGKSAVEYESDPYLAEMYINK